MKAAIFLARFLKWAFLPRPPTVKAILGTLLETLALA